MPTPFPSNAVNRTPRTSVRKAFACGVALGVLSCLGVATAVFAWTDPAGGGWKRTSTGKCCASAAPRRTRGDEDPGGGETTSLRKTVFMTIITGMLRTASSNREKRVSKKKKASKPSGERKRARQPEAVVPAESASPSLRGALAFLAVAGILFFALYSLETVKAALSAG